MQHRLTVTASCQCVANDVLGGRAAGVLVGHAPQFKFARYLGALGHVTRYLRHNGLECRQPQRESRPSVVTHPIHYKTKRAAAAPLASFLFPQHS